MAPVRVATFSVSLPATKYGFSTHLSTLVSRKPISRSGASRKSSAWRVGGVSSTIRSKRASAARSSSRSIAMYSWLPASADETWP